MKQNTKVLTITGQIGIIVSTTYDDLVLVQFIVRGGFFHYAYCNTTDLVAVDHLAYNHALTLYTQNTNLCDAEETN